MLADRQNSVKRQVPLVFDGLGTTHKQRACNSPSLTWREPFFPSESNVTCATPRALNFAPLRVTLLTKINIKKLRQAIKTAPTAQVTEILRAAPKEEIRLYH